MDKLKILFVALLLLSNVAYSEERCKGDGYDFRKLLRITHEEIKNVRIGKGGDININKFINIVNDVIRHSSELECYHVGIESAIYHNIAVLAVLSESKRLIKAYIDFIIDIRGSANEMIYIDYAKLYFFHPKEIVQAIAKRKSTEERQYLVKSLSEGIFILLFSYCTRNNYRKTIATFFKHIGIKGKYDREIYLRVIKLMKKELTSNSTEDRRDK